MDPKMAAAIAAHQKDQQKKKKVKVKDPPAGSAAKPASFHSFDSFDAKRSMKEAHGKAQKRALPDSDSEESKEDGEDRVEKVDWSNPPEELQDPPVIISEPSEEGKEEEGAEVGGHSSASYVNHFIRFLMGRWRKKRETDGFSPEVVANQKGPQLSHAAVETYKSEKSLKETEEALAPLICQLGKGEVDMEVLKRLYEMAMFSAQREYKKANQSYIELTLGKKKWHNAYFGGEAKHNKGFHARRVSRSELNKFDSDDTVQKYVQAIRRVIVFGQFLRPPDNPSNSLSI